LAFFAPTEIPLTLLATLGDEVSVLRAVGRLRAYSMLSDEAAGLKIHRLVQETARTPDDHDAHRTPDLIDQARNDALVALQTNLPDETQDPAQWPIWRALLPHVRAFANHTRPRRRYCAP
jgi:hypothetical protein